MNLIDFLYSVTDKGSAIVVLQVRTYETGSHNRSVVKSVLSAGTCFSIKTWHSRGVFAPTGTPHRTMSV